MEYEFLDIGIRIEGTDMRKKWLSLLMLSTCVFLLAGCNNVKDLTDDETKLIAEYAAGLLLEYDVNYVDRIEEGDKAAQEMAEEASTEQASTEQDDTQEVTTEEQSEDDTEDNTSAEERIVGSEGDIAKIAGIAGVSVSLKDYQIVDRYPETKEEDTVVDVEAADGYKLLVIRFKVQNTTEDVVNVSLIDKQLEYHIVCNGVDTAEPMLTILMNDLGTLETSIQPGEEQEAVLLFQISDNMKEQLESIDLYINFNNTDNMLEIL